MAFVVRSQWYVVPAMNGYGTGDWDLTGGSDPWYMKRVVDYILLQNAHLVFDADKLHPLGGINPRPPLFVWAIALLAMILEPFSHARRRGLVGYGFGPAIFGALTVFPVAAIARDHVSKPAAVIAAWLIAMMLRTHFPFDVGQRGPRRVRDVRWRLASCGSFVPWPRVAMNA